MAFSRTHFFFLICLLATGIYFLAGVPAFYPLNPWDEAFYIMLAQKPLAMTPLDFPVLYVGFLKFLKLFVQNSQELFFLDIQVQTIALSLLVYLAAAKLRMQPILCFIAAYLILISNINAPIVFSKTNHLNACFFLCIFLISTWIQSRFWKLFFLGSAILVSLYLRVENAAIFPVFIFYSFWSFGRKEIRQSVSLLFSMMLVSVILFFGFRSPLGGDRIWWAFADWYYWKQNVRTHIFETDMIVSQRGAVSQFMHQVFGDASNLFQAMISNPVAYFQHLSGNTLAWMVNMPIWLTGHFPLTPGRFLMDPRLQSVIETLLIFAIFFLFSRFLSKRTGEARPVSVPRSKNNAVFLFLMTGLLVKGLVLSALLSAAPRYSLEFVVFFFIYLLWILQSRLSWQFEHRAALCFVALLFVVCPTHRNTQLQKAYINEGDVFYGETIRMLQKIQIHHELRLFCSTPIDTYLEREQRSYTGSDFFKSPLPNPDLYEFLEAHYVNSVVIDKKIGMRFREAGRFQELEKFLKGADEKGYVLLLKGEYQKDWPFIVLVKKELLK